MLSSWCVGSFERRMEKREEERREKEDKMGGESEALWGLLSLLTKGKPQQIFKGSKVGKEQFLRRTI